jgi:hypothetical protein
MKPGWKSTEFWITAMVVLPWLLKTWGFDLGFEIPTDPETLTNYIGTAQEGITTALVSAGDAPAWVAGLYAISRAIVKFKDWK